MRLKILDAGKELFWRHGIKRISVEEICRKAGISKMTFYRYFPNKVGLALVIIENIIRDGEEAYRRIMQAKIPYSEKVKQMLALKMETSEGISPEIIQELCQNPIPEIDALLHKKREQNLQVMLNDFMEAQKSGDVRRDIKPEFIIFLLNHLVKLAEDDRLSGMYESYTELAMELTRFFFFGILPREPHK